MKKLFFLILFSAIVFFVKAQEITRNSVYAEIGGAGLLYSVNYERLLSSNKNNNFPIRIGLTLLPPKLSGNLMLGIPLGVSFIKNINREMYFETRLLFSTFIEQKIYNGHGLGSEPTVETHVMYMPSIAIGFRHQPESKGFYYHYHFQVSYNTEIFWGIMPWLGFGLGYAY